MSSTSSRGYVIAFVVTDGTIYSSYLQDYQEHQNEILDKLIAIKGDDGKLKGFNVLAGGGMGATHNMKKTYPQLGRMFGYCDKEDVHIVAEKIMLVQRDNGDRKNRKHARLKYTIDDMGVDAFKGKVEELWGKQFDEPKPFHFDSNVPSN